MGLTEVYLSQKKLLTQQDIQNWRNLVRYNYNTTYLQVIIILVILILSRMLPVLNSINIISAKLKFKPNKVQDKYIYIFFKERLFLPLADMASVVLSRHMRVKLIIPIERGSAEFTHRMSRKTTSFTLSAIDFRVTCVYMLIQLCSSI